MPLSPEQKKQNSELWNEVFHTDPKHTKEVKGKGMPMTAIDAQWQRQRATQMFGPCGIGWRVENERFFEIVFDPNKPHDTNWGYQGILVYEYNGREGRIPLAADMALWQYLTKESRYKKNTDILKKLKTDALTKGLSEIGFSGDVFLGLFEDSKYVQEMDNQFRSEEIEEENLIKEPLLERIDALEARLKEVSGGKISEEDICAVRITYIKSSQWPPNRLSIPLKNLQAYEVRLANAIEKQQGKAA